MARPLHFVHSSATKPTPFEGYTALLDAYITMVDQGMLVPASGQLSLFDARSLATLLQANALKFFSGQAPTGP